MNKMNSSSDHRKEQVLIRNADDCVLRTNKTEDKHQHQEYKFKMNKIEKKNEITV